MNNRIPYTSYQGTAAALCSKGDAVEFIQPWYTPISTTPENTGMAVGGIGNTFTLTPEGKTPNFSFIPGIFIDCQQDNIHFNDFYLSVMEPINSLNLSIPDIKALRSFLTYYPAEFGLTLSDNVALSDHLSSDLILEKLRENIAQGEFYRNNRFNFTRWRIEFSPKTQQAITAAPDAVTTQLLVVLDFFNGLIVNNTAQAVSLTANNHGNIPSVESEEITYRALYPLAEYQYSSLNGVQVTRKVVSPIVKDDSQLCSLPLHWNHFELSNTSDNVMVATLAQPLQNLIGSTYRKQRDGIQDSCCTLIQNPIKQHHKPHHISGEGFEFMGVHMSSKSPYGADIEGELIYGVHARSELITSGKVTVSVKSQLYSSKLEQPLECALNTGRVNNHFDRGIYSGREALSAIVCVQVELNPGESIDLRFAQVMDYSKISLAGWQSEKAYVSHFPAKQRANAILSQTLPELLNIEAQIISQQQAFLSLVREQFQNECTCQRLATQYVATQCFATHCFASHCFATHCFATMALNSLSFLAESTVWDHNNTFLVKECVDYPFFNSLDVYFYGSFSLLYLLPQLDGHVMEHFAEAILASDDTLRRYWEYEDKPHAELMDDKYQGMRATRGAVIHDLGSPYDIQPDAYSWHNVKEWKDLAPKYILMVYRHYQKTGNIELVRRCWAAITESIEFLTVLIEEGDTLPLTRGTDDTFDNLSSHGISIYCGSLWAAGLKAAGQLADIMGEKELAFEYQHRSKAALDTLERALWDEKQGYYHFFATPIQTKHLSGGSYQPLAELGLILSGNKVKDAAILNHFLDDTDLHCEQSKLEQRLIKKRKLLECAPAAFNPSYQMLVCDSDNSFGDALLADSYLKLVGLEGLFKQDRIERTLDFIYNTNFIANSPTLGVANMTLADGRPHAAFQAQDVWIGVQFSVATAMKLAGKQAQAKKLINTVYNALYQLAKIPFAAPEGFNSSVAVTTESLQSEFALDSKRANEWLGVLIKQGILLQDGRISPELTERTLFSQQIADEIEENHHLPLYNWLKSTGLKYTAGRYFRPGMIFAYLY